jgi:Rieske-like [2Fe-2S] domain
VFAALRLAAAALPPPQRALVLSQGIIGSRGDLPKVACPLHKKNFNLSTGECMDDETMPALLTFPVKVEEDGSVHLQLPPVAELDALLATDKVIFGADCEGAVAASVAGVNGQNSFVPFSASGVSVPAAK